MSLSFIASLPADACRRRSAMPARLCSTAVLLLALMIACLEISCARSQRIGSEACKPGWSCKKLKDCPWGRTEIKSGRSPQLCGFKGKGGKEALICCPGRAILQRPVQKPAPKPDPRPVERPPQNPMQAPPAQNVTQQPPTPTQDPANPRAPSQFYLVYY